VAHLEDLVIDCAHPASLARFWAEVLDGYAVAPYDDAELERLRAMGIDDPEDDPVVFIVGPPGTPRWCFQRVPEPRVAKNRMHADLWSDDRDAEVERLLALGATVLEHQPPPGDDLLALADPEGNELCLVRRRAG
jgi:hypothetical protein